MALGGRLSRRLDLDVYVGTAGATEILRLPGAHPPGAIVIGLGDVGDLTPERLTKLVAHAAVRYAVRVADASSTGTWVSAAFSTLLIGNDSGSMTTADSIRAIVRGVLEANRRLRATKTVGSRAHRPLAVRRAVRGHRRTGRAHCQCAAGDARARADALRRCPADATARRDAWRRVLASAGRHSSPGLVAPRSGDWQDVKPVAAGGHRSRLSSSFIRRSQTGPNFHRARPCSPWPQVSRLVDASMLQSTADLKLSNTLFELLLPTSFKNSIRHGGDLLLLLNRSAARYPFELMADREGGCPTPLIAKCGMLRQLELPEQPRKTDITSGRGILVIGPPLALRPGRRFRARARKRIGLPISARDRGYKPTLLVNASSRDVQTEVFASDARDTAHRRARAVLRQSLSRAASSSATTNTSRPRTLRRCAGCRSSCS